MGAGRRPQHSLAPSSAVHPLVRRRCCHHGHRIHRRRRRRRRHLSFRGALPLWAIFCLAACSWTAIYLYYINYGLDEAKYDTFFSGSVAGINCQFVVIGLTYLALALVAELLLLRDLAVLESSD